MAPEPSTMKSCPLMFWRCSRPSLGDLSEVPLIHDEGFVDLSRALCFSEWCSADLLTADLLSTAEDAFGLSVEGGCTTSITLIGVYPPLRDPV